MMVTLLYGSGLSFWSVHGYASRTGFGSNQIVVRAGKGIKIGYAASGAIKDDLRIR